jgi:DNA-binding CsgD family transcriptional regulator/PAS domain-containing protein
MGRMSEAEALSQVIGAIYDAALDQNLWATALEQACRFVRTIAAAVYVQNPALKTGTRYHSWGDDVVYTHLYFTEYVKINPLVPLMMLQGVGQVYACSTLMPYEEFRASRFFKEWVDPQNLVDFVAINVEKSATSAATVSMGRDRMLGFVDDDARRRMALVAPHLRRSVLIGNVIHLGQSDARTLTAMFDGLAAAVFLVDAAGRIMFANPVAQAMLDNGAQLRDVKGALCAVDAQADSALHEVFSACVQGDAAVGIKGIALRLSASPGECWIAHVLPLTSGARPQSDIARTATAAVFVRKAQIDAPSAMECVAKLYKLTPGELRVLYTIMNTSGVSAAAQALGLSEATIKAHLQHLFQKTGVERQADLVKLVAAHASPFAL